MYIKELWLVIGFYMFLLSFVNNKLIRLLAIILFLTFVFISANRSIDLNSDTKNYAIHITSFIDAQFSIEQIFSWNWEIGYNTIVIILAHIIPSVKVILFIITFLPGLIFAIIFFKYKYHPSIIFYIYSTILLVASTTTMRHWWALAISFLVLNQYIFLNKRNMLNFIVPVFFHYSTIPLSLILIIDVIKKYFIKKIFAITIIVIILIILINKISIIYFLYHFKDRLFSDEFRFIGFRNLNNLFFIFLILVNRSKIKINRLNFLLLSSLIVSIILMPFYGINRITSFFTLIILIYLNKVLYKEKVVNIYSLSISILGLMSLIYFYSKHSIIN